MVANVAAALAPGSALAGPSPRPTLFEVLALDAAAPPLFPPPASTLYGIIYIGSHYYRKAEVAKTAAISGKFACHTTLQDLP